MADPKHLELLQQGVDAWNAWREKEPTVLPDLSEANLSGANLSGVNLRGVKLPKTILWGADLRGATLIEGADLTDADLTGADLRGADLSGAKLVEANLRGANLSGATLVETNFRLATLNEAKLKGAVLKRGNFVRADLNGADLSAVDLSGANLRFATLVETELTDADLTGCKVYGTSAWRLKLSQNTRQQSLIITARDEPEITVDDIEVAQFIYLLMNNEKIRNVIDTITSKVVLILGRFTAERKAALNALRDELRKPGRNYVPIVFKFDRSPNQTIAETVALLARMARFVIADLTDAKSVLQELRDIVPNNPMLAVQPLILATQDEPGMFDFFRKFPWVSKTYRYDNLTQLTEDLDEGVLRPVEAKVLELRAPQP